MATTAAILKIDIWRLLLNHLAIWVETLIVATEWLLDQKYVKFCRSEIQDGPTVAILKTNFWFILPNH